MRNSRNEQCQSVTAGNLRSDLKRRRRQISPMQIYDALPQPLRQWLAQASLPWSPTSALKIWRQTGGSDDPAAAICRLNAVEQVMLQRDAKVWVKNG